MKFIWIFILILVIGGCIGFGIPKLLAEETPARLLEVKPYSMELQDGKVKLSEFKEGGRMSKTITFLLTSKTPDWQFSYSPMKLEISSIQTTGIVPPPGWYEDVTYELSLPDNVQNTELLSTNNQIHMLILKKLEPKGEIPFQLTINFPPIPKGSAFQALADRQGEIIGNIKFTFDYLTAIHTAQESPKSVVYNHVTLPPVRFLLVVKGIFPAWLILLMCSAIIPLGGVAWWMSRKEPYELELEGGEPKRIQLSRIQKYPLCPNSGETVCTINRRLLGGLKAVPKAGYTINGSEKPKFLPDRGGDMLIESTDEGGNLFINAYIKKIVKKQRRCAQEGRIDIDELC